MSRRYLLLPTIPEDLAAWPQERLSEFHPVLAPATGGEGEDESFRVICLTGYQTKLVLFVYHSTIRQWHTSAYPMLILSGTLSRFDCVRGCFYWTVPWAWQDGLVVLDTHTMRFSTVDLLTGYHLQLRDLPDTYHSVAGCAIVVGREGALEMFSLVCQHGSFDLHHTALQNNSQEWRLEKIIPLPGQYRDYSISTVGAAEGFLFFRGSQGYIFAEDVDCFSLDVKTYQITKVCSRMEQYYSKHAHPYFGFPPFLSDPTV